MVEAEKTNRDVVKRGYRELVGARADVAIVLNKVGPIFRNGWKVKFKVCSAGLQKDV